MGGETKNLDGLQAKERVMKNVSEHDFNTLGNLGWDQSNIIDLIVFLQHKSGENRSDINQVLSKKMGDDGFVMEGNSIYRKSADSKMSISEALNTAIVPLYITPQNIKFINGFDKKLSDGILDNNEKMMSIDELAALEVVYGQDYIDKLKSVVEADLAALKDQIKNVGTETIEKGQLLRFDGAPKLDDTPGISQAEFKSLDAFITKLDNDSDKRKIWLELKKPGYKELKDLLLSVDQQFGFQFLMMDEIDPNTKVKPQGYTEEVNFYEQYTKLMTKLLGTTSVKSVAELEASAQSDMSTFIDKQYKRLSGLDPKSESTLDEWVDFFDLVGKHAQEVRYTSVPGSDAGWKVSSSSLNPFTTLQQLIKKGDVQIDIYETDDESGPISMKNEVARLRKDIDEAASPEKVMEATSRFRFLHALDVFANSVDDQSLSIEDKKRALNILSKKMQYITDINITLTDGKTKAKDFLDAKLLDLAKQDGVIADEALSKDIDNFRDDLNYESHAYGLTMTVEDGVDHAEIVRSAEQVAKGDRIEYVGYLDYTENIKRLDSNRDGEKLIPGQIEKYFTSSELDLSRLSYMDSQSAERLVKAINNNPHIQSVTFNAMLMKERLGKVPLIAILNQLKNIKKDVTVMVGRDSLGYKTLSYDWPLLSTLAAPDSDINKLTILADAFQAEQEMNQLGQFPGSLALPRIIDTPLDDESTKEFVKKWAEGHPNKSLELGFIKTSNVLPEAIDEFGQKGQTYSFPRLQELQVDGGSPLSYTQANVLLPSQKDITDDLLAIGDREMKTTVDKIDRKEKKQKTIDKTAGVYDFSAMSIDEQKAKDIRTFFRGNELTIQKPSSDDNLLEIAQARNLTKLHLVSKSAPSPDKIKDIGSSAPSPDKIKDIGSSAPSPDKIKDIGSSAPSPDKIKDIHDKYYIDTLDLQGVDMTTLATDAYKNAIADYSNLSVQSEAASTPSADQWKSLMSFQGNLTIDQPITINLKDLGDALATSHPRTLTLKNRKSLVMKDDKGEDQTIEPDTLFKDRYMKSNKKDTQKYDLLDFFKVLKDNKVNIDFADGADQYPAILYQEYLKQQ